MVTVSAMKAMVVGWWCMEDVSDVYDGGTGGGNGHGGRGGLGECRNGDFAPTMMTPTEGRLWRAHTAVSLALQ